MDAKGLRIVFMGTPDFAVESLRRLVEGGYNVVGVVTAPDKPSGRGLKVTESAVKRYAVAKGLRVMQPEKLKDPAFLDELREAAPDLGIVIAFRMLPEAVWSMPRLGTFNLHASLLPQYRGAAPISRAIMNGETRTGVTTFFLNDQIDTGDIIGSREVAITSDDTAGTLHDKLMAVGADMVVETVERIAVGTSTPVRQREVGGPLQGAPKIFKEDCRIDWNRPCAKVRDFIRGLSPSPAAWSELGSVAGGEQTRAREGCQTAHDVFAAREGRKPVHDVSAAREGSQPTHDVSANGQLFCESGSPREASPPLSVKIFAADIVPESAGELPPGSVVSDNKAFMHVACADGMLAVSELQMAGKKRMTTEEFLRGFKIIGGHRFR